tara:strand:+ start:367 stop:594 length:228 start_codon:yes stop_codon:yes gene_type:complete
MNTFFFGYLPLKWKRLARVLSILFTLFFPFIFLIWLDGNGMTEDEEFFLAGMSAVVIIILIGLISYVLKPFIVKD